MPRTADARQIAAPRPAGQSNAGFVVMVAAMFALAIAAVGVARLAHPPLHAAAQALQP